MAKSIGPDFTRSELETSLSNNSQTPDMLEDGRKGMNFLLLIIRAWAISLEVFLHHRMGARYPGNAGALVLVFVPFYILWWEEYDVTPMFFFMLAYLTMCVVHRLASIRRRLQKREMGHSHYNGIPLIWRFFRHQTECQVKLILQPALIFMYGILVAALNRPLGYYILGGTICMAASTAISMAIDRHETMNLHDSLIEQQMLAKRFREERGE